MRYPDLEVVLVERYQVLAEMWRYLIGVSPEEVRRIPYVEHVDELPSWVPDGGRYLVGFSMNAACASPRKQLSAGRRKLAGMGRHMEGWTVARRERVAVQVERIRHWRIIEGDYTEAPDVEATWFVDPPYSSPAGRHYVHADIDFPALGAWCRGRKGQVIVCENEGATWLPFQPFGQFKAGITRNGQGTGSREAVWLSA